MGGIDIGSEKKERSTLWLTYLMYVLVVPAALGAGINWLKTRDESFSRRSVGWVGVVQSHHLWLQRTFGAAFFLVMVALGTIYTGFGYFILIGTGLWWAYRIIRGIQMLAEDQAMPVAE